MAVIRRENGNLEIQRADGSIAIGRMRAIYQVDQAERTRWLDACAQLVSSCAHTDLETEEYFLTLCDTVPILPDDRGWMDFKCNLLRNHFADQMEHRPGRPSREMDDAQLEQWEQEERALRLELEQTPPERFGLVIRGYRLPYTERNEPFYQEVRQVYERRIRAHPEWRAHPQTAVRFPDICFFFEETTGARSAHGGGFSLMEQLICFRGVDAEEIEQRNRRFQGYIDAMWKQGRLPSPPWIEQGISEL